MDKFYIIANSEKDEGLKVSERVAKYLESKGKSCTIRPASFGNRAPFTHYTDIRTIPDDVECVIVLGGDGTLLQAARDVVSRQIPLLGINLGTLGYLAEIDKDSIEPALNHLIADAYTIERRMMLSGKVYHRGKMVAEDVALNDIVIGREGPLRVIRFNNYVNGEFLNSYHGRRDYYLHRNRLYRIQPFRRRSYCISGNQHYDYDTGCPSYLKYQKYYFSCGG